jgi:hypothetical protein
MNAKRRAASVLLGVLLGVLLVACASISIAPIEPGNAR